jgi:chemotaxis protein MotB
VEISKLEPDKFSAVGYSEFYPIADNETSAGRAKNRRVDFFIESVGD